jgi:tripartite-type tricarboxylate transporter receptor subunit TctC
LAANFADTRATSWPSKSIRFIVLLAVDSAGNKAARIVAQKIPAMHRPKRHRNQPGASGLDGVGQRGQATPGWGYRG